MTEQQQELYEKLLKKVNEYCLGYAAEDVIAAIDALVDTYETPKVDPTSTPLQALENIIESFFDKDSEDIKTVRKALKENGKLKECYKNELKNTAYYNNLALKYKRALKILKEKDVDIEFEITKTIDYADYWEKWKDYADDFDLLTQEEYELLKEILK